MAEAKEKSIYVAILMQSYYGKNPTAVMSLVAFPGESMGQLASRMKQYMVQQGYKNATGYGYDILCGELTHQVPPPPPPKPLELVKLKKIPTAVPRRAAMVATKLKTLKPA